eukprot:Skav216945  [mRNA]  locus=scaffold3396:165368:169167:+ [translate_table: standard]
MAGDDGCQSCGHANAEFCCSRCKAKFCNPQCYRDAWPKHKVLCRPAGKPSDGDGKAGESADIREILEGKIFATQLSLTMGTLGKPVEPQNLMVCFYGRIWLVAFTGTRHSLLAVIPSLPLAVIDLQAIDGDVKGRVLLSKLDGVSIVAYCDSELPSTLLALLCRSERPQLISVGLVWQGAAELTRELGIVIRVRTEPSFQLPNGSTLRATRCYGGHLRILQLAASEARGPCWARYLAQLLWDQEELYLQLDSHMRFVSGWDSKARSQLRSCRARSAKPILCSYGRAYERGTPYNMAPRNVTGPDHGD